MFLGQGLIFTVQQLFYLDSTVVIARMVAPAHHFVIKRDTVRWRISLSVPNRCSRVEYRRIFVGNLSQFATLKDSLRCAFKGEKFSFMAELSDENAGQLLKRLKGKSLKQAKDFLLSSLNYEYSDSGVVLWVLVAPKRKPLNLKVEFGYSRQWATTKMYDLGEIKIGRDTILSFLIPKEELSYGKVRFVAKVGSLKRETEVLFNQFNIENDRDFKVLLSVLNFVFGPQATQELAKTPPQKRREAWKKFWETRGGDKAAEEFMRRLYTAMRLYPSSFRAKVSDRALIYTKFGPPDEVESYPYRMEGKPYEIWYYHRLGKKFIFMDLDGSGDYRLVPESYIELMR
ncbi:MAG: GWxTD domain-containing protein [Thermotogae bacterium]|nr:GWxTD domain-containing protein [Thermotogota bacterium]